MPSIFAPGAGGTLKAVTEPAALFELARALDAAENARNGANPGLPPKRNITTTVSFDTGVIAIAASLPISTTIATNGTLNLTASDYLGAPYSDFANGGGDLESTNLVAAFVEMSQMLSASEKAVQPVDDQPNNVEVTVDFESGTLTVSASLPFSTTTDASGFVVIQAADYL